MTGFKRAAAIPSAHPADLLSAARLQQVFNQETGSTLRLAAVTVSVGEACARLGEPDDLDGLIAAADTDMYERRAQLRLSTGASSERSLSSRD